MKQFFCTTIIVHTFLCVANAQELSKSQALALINSHSTELQISTAGDNNLYITNAYYDPKVDLTYIYAQQTYKGLKLFNVIKSTVFKHNTLQSNMGDFVADINSKTNNATPAINAITAVQKALTHLGLQTTKNLNEVENSFGTNKKIIFSTGGIAKRNIEAELVWRSVDDEKTFQLAWSISIDVAGSSDYWNLRVNAASGEIIDKGNYTVYENNNSTGTKFNMPKAKKNARTNLKLSLIHI